MKLETITEAEVERIAEAFADYAYEDGDNGLFYLFPDKEHVKIYMRAFVHAAEKAGWIYTTSEKREGYIVISDSGSAPPLSALFLIIKGCLKALGFKGVIAFIQTLQKGGVSLESRLKKDKQAFVKIEMLVVTKPYQGQGYMRKAADIAFQLAAARRLPCILDTDARLKRDKYVHLGMECVGTRQIGDHAYLYDLIKYPKEEHR